MAFKIIRGTDAVLRSVARALIRGYQRTVGLLLAGHCRFHPTCSEYAMTVFQRCHFFRACRLTLWRLLRCHPFCPGGDDPPPEK